MTDQHAKVVDEVAKGVELKHAETVDKSAPQIPSMFHSSPHNVSF